MGGLQRVAHAVEVTLFLESRDRPEQDRARGPRAWRPGSPENRTTSCIPTPERIRPGQRAPPARHPLAHPRPRGHDGHSLHEAARRPGPPRDDGRRGPGARRSSPSRRRRSPVRRRSRRVEARARPLRHGRGRRRRAARPALRRRLPRRHPARPRVARRRRPQAPRLGRRRPPRLRRLLHRHGRARAVPFAIAGAASVAPLLTAPSATPPRTPSPMVRPGPSPTTSTAPSTPAPTQDARDAVSRRDLPPRRRRPRRLVAKAS